MKSPLRLAAISIKNVLGIEEFYLEPGPKRTVIKGRNGAGKSTIIAAILNVLSPGAALASLQRLVGGEPSGEPEAVVVLRGADSEEKRITKVDGATPTIESRVGQTAAFEKLKQPGAYLRTIFDAAGANPVRFLMATGKEQMALLLEALRLNYDSDRVVGILGRFKAIVDAENLPLDLLNPIQRVEAQRDAIFRARTGVNRDVKSKRAAADQTRRDSPAEIPEGVDARIVATRAAVTAAQTEHTERQGAIRAAYREAEQAAEARKVARIAEAEAECATSLMAALEVASTAKSELDGLAAMAKAAENELTTLLRDSKDAERARTMLATAKKFDDDAESLDGEAEAMTEVIGALDAYRTEMASEIPIPGLSLDGGIKVDGIPLEQVNTGKRVRIAVDIARLRAKDTRLATVFLDGAEALDDDNREQLFDALEEAGVQFVATLVTDDDLSIEKK